jgi:hypothetical protein
MKFKKLKKSVNFTVISESWKSRNSNAVSVAFDHNGRYFLPESLERVLLRVQPIYDSNFIW